MKLDEIEPYYKEDLKVEKKLNEEDIQLTI